MLHINNNTNHGKNIHGCYVHHEYEGKFAMVYSDHANNTTPKLVRVNDNRFRRKWCATGYPVKLDVKCTFPVDTYATICRIIDCDHSKDCPILILEPLFNIPSEKAIELPMLEFFNCTGCFADSDLYGATIYDANCEYTYLPLYVKMREFDDSIDVHHRTYMFNKDENNEKILNLLISGIITIDDIYRYLA